MPRKIHTRQALSHADHRSRLHCAFTLVSPLLSKHVRYQISLIRCTFGAMPKPNPKPKPTPRLFLTSKPKPTLKPKNKVHWNSFRMTRSPETTWGFVWYPTPATCFRAGPMLSMVQCDLWTSLGGYLRPQRPNYQCHFRVQIKMLNLCWSQKDLPPPPLPINIGNLLKLKTIT